MPSAAKRQPAKLQPSRRGKFVDQLVDELAARFGVVELRASRGVNYARTKRYQVRLRPGPGSPAPATLPVKLERYLRRRAKQLGLAEVTLRERAANSGRFAGVAFERADRAYELVLATGRNQGETLEANLRRQLGELVGSGHQHRQAMAALVALTKADSSFKPASVRAVHRGYARQRGAVPLMGTGAAIADIVLELRDGTRRHVSVKGRDGKTLAQFGVARAFNQDLSVNEAAREWRLWLAPLGLSAKQVRRGLLAASGRGAPLRQDTVTVDRRVKPNSFAFKVLERMWGSGYYYLKETARGFKALWVTPELVREQLLGDLKVRELRYPSPTRRQVDVYLESRAAKYKLSLRNPKGNGAVRPTQAQLILRKSLL
jgi:hypothetical protein